MARFGIKRNRKPGEKLSPLYQKAAIRQDESVGLAFRVTSHAQSNITVSLHQAFER